MSTITANPTTAIRTIELDTVLDQSPESWITEQAQNGIRAEVVTLSGPGGGNPIFRYTGAIQALMGLLVASFEFTVDEAIAQLS
ncbi:hypothetical protein SEA_SIXAMA_198 [Gordonia phage Sixama]|uniref:Uncharacterized protein n=1 Tax=Gordonia phage Sixama TaxID=2653271 RepID=A0A5Q2F0A0_9CAUD|nr:hypothetical protein PP302_gp001 [Gordonia phage Sixama]YP_010648878.1 hypothetical protein PP302_gp131 [Gordonia phage Sixama]QGF20180.1 hypothetical protein SEA_SIXAMA_1 [Gordonia phage Sixama]QGF20348.1 hypothetical protein SEA_SIXAMA_198 [Gordonia phage Sixama]